jgi:hypothetical protein
MWHSKSTAKQTQSTNHSMASLVVEGENLKIGDTKENERKKDFQAIFDVYHSDAKTKDAEKSDNKRSVVDPPWKEVGPYFRSMKKKKLVALLEQAWERKGDMRLELASALSDTWKNAENDVTYEESSLTRVLLSYLEDYDDPKTMAAFFHVSLSALASSKRMSPFLSHACSSNATSFFFFMDLK